MKAVFLDFATVRSDALDLATLQNTVSELVLYDHTTPSQVKDRIGDAALVFTNKVRLDETVFRATPALRFIGLVATGVDNIDLAAAAARNIAVCNIRAYCTQSIVEHVFSVMLYFNRSLGRYRDIVRAGKWQDAQNFCMLDFPIRELSALTLGIIGHGELGSAVGRMARNFDMRVLVARRKNIRAAAGDGRVDLADLLRESDVVSLHCPLTDDNRDLIGQDELTLMKRDAILINTARGGLVNSSALVAALTEGRIAAAAIDVLDAEPPRDGDPLLAFGGDQLVVTPHVAWASTRARQNAINQLAENVADFVAGGHSNRVDQPGL